MHIHVWSRMYAGVHVSWLWFWVLLSISHVWNSCLVWLTYFDLDHIGVLPFEIADHRVEYLVGCYLSNVQLYGTIQVTTTPWQGATSTQVCLWGGKTHLHWGCSLPGRGRRLLWMLGPRSLTNIHWNSRIALDTINFKMHSFFHPRGTVVLYLMII